MKDRKQHFIEVRPGRFSSVVGQAIHIRYPKGRVLGMLQMLCFDLPPDDLEQVAQDIADALECADITFPSVR